MTLNKQKDNQHFRKVQEGYRPFEKGYQPTRGTIDRSNPPGNDGRNGTDRGSNDHSKQNRNR